MELFQIETKIPCITENELQLLECIIITKRGFTEQVSHF